MFAAFLQSILFNFTSLYELYLDLDSFYMKDEYYSSLSLISNEFTNLQKLTIICSEERYINDVVKMFSKVQSIKSFSICCPQNLDFYTESVLKLEELNIWYTDFRGGTDDLERYKKYLISQKSTLTKYRDEENKLCEFVRDNLLDLETLHMSIRSDEPFNNHFMITNDKLKCLTLSYYDGDNEKLENVLSTYSNLERLMIKMAEFGQEMLGPIVGIELNNLTHLWLDGLLSSVLLNVKMPNLKFLEISNNDKKDPYNFWRVPPENFMNLEKLSINHVWRMKEIYHVLTMCPKLTYLNLGRFKEFEGYLSPRMIDIMLAHTHQLRFLGLLKDNQTMTREELQSHIHKNIVVKFYDKFKTMMKDYWKIEYFGSYETGMDILI
jgi:hypothetical protein